MENWYANEGAPLPLGVTWIEEDQAYNFALYSRHASAVTLLLYSDHDLVQPLMRISLDHLRNKSGRIWHCRLRASEVGDAQYYGYSVDGPSSADEHSCHRFDPEKILFDPYARGLFFPPLFSRSASIGMGSNAARTALGVVSPRISEGPSLREARPHHTSDTIIYEMHVRGFTMRPNSGVSADKRGTFAGVIEKIPYLKELGVTVVELLPVFQYDPDEGNFWGYMPLSFFAPHRSYAAHPEAALDEFREMVRALHRADIEVILDVVYNHTAEAGDDGPTYSYRGICASTYYLLDPSMEHYRNDTGAGNVLRVAHPAVRQLVLDSLRFWVNEMEVDGFRFDLASIFARSSDGSLNLEDPPIVSEISSAPDFADIRLIAEPWDLGSYLLGRGFPGNSWAQWNGRFRDTIRSFVRGDPGKVGDVITRLYGSDDLFPDSVDEAYHPYQSINFVTCHDGFCLYDLVSYDGKHNEANGESNADGSDNNLSWNCGWEGDEGVPAEVLSLRRRQVKNFCCLLLLANGTPMLCAGDEFMNTQRGNNNPYNQDNETTWLDWALLEKNQDIFRFFKQMIAFRKAHPSIGRSRFWREDVTWYGVGAEADLSDSSHSVAFCLHGGAHKDRDIYVMINAYWEDLVFDVQEGNAHGWVRFIDTSLPSPQDFLAPGSEEALASREYRVKARSVVLLLGREVGRI